MSIEDRFEAEEPQYEIIVIEDGVSRVVTLDEWLKEKE